MADALTNGAVELRDVCKSYIGGGGRAQIVEVLRSLSFTVKQGEFFSILGPSGSGKTTCLRILAGLVTADSGVVEVDGRSISGPGADRALVFQSFNLLPWRTALQNVEFGLRMRKIGSRKEQTERSRHYLELVGLTGFEDHFPHQLSGGMQQRVGIARALAIEPSVLLMDEPFASVDAQTRETLQSELLKILARTEATVIFITHSIDEAIFLSDSFVVFSPRPSYVLEQFEVKLPKQRWTYDARSDPEFARLRHEAWQLLRTTTDPTDE